MDVSGQFAPAALPLGRDPPVRIVLEAGWASKLPWTWSEEKNLCL
jgi:hypothetical protein